MPVLIILVTIALAIFIPILWWLLTFSRYKSLKNIPGPTPLPLVGSAGEIGKTTIELLRSFKRLQDKYGPIYKIWIGPRLHLVITKPEYVEYFLNSTDHLSKSDGYDLFKPWLGDGLLVSTGLKWKSRRKLITPTFHFKILEQFLEVFNNQINILLDVLSKEVEKNPGPMEIHNFVNLMSLDIICETAFGTPLNAQSRSNPKYVEAVTGYLEIYSLRFFSGWQRNSLLFRLSPAYAKYVKYLRILHDFTNGIIKKRKEEFETKGSSPESNEHGIKRRAALLDMLLEVSDGGKVLSDEDIRAEVDTFMFEGHDTISAAICFVLYAVVQNPSIQNKIYEELIEVLGYDSKSEITSSQLNDLKYLDLVIKEAQRIYPPVPIIERSLDEACTLDGFTIPKDTTITIFLYGMNYSPDVFPEPEKFDPERFLPEKQTARHNFAYVPFSAGPRNCIGQKFAVMELKATIAKLLRHFELLPDPNFKAEIGWCSVLKSKNGIKVQLKPRTKPTVEAT